jgi:hypothetical protein
MNQSGEVMEKRKIKAEDVAADVQAGLGDGFLIEKYGLTPRQLEKVLKRLLAADFINHLQFYERTTLSDSIITKAFG